MRVSDAFPSKYLKVEDLDDQDLHVTIKDTTVEELGQGAEKQKKLIVYFKECEKGLACNKTNANTIAKMYGDDTDVWVGQRITLWPNHDVEFKGEIVSAIRVRSRAPGKPGAAAAPASNGLLGYKQAVQLCADAGIREVDMKNYLKSCGMTGYIAKDCTPLVHTLIAGLGDPSRGDAPTDDDGDVPF